MVDHAVENEEIYVYTGGQAPEHITHARIDESVEEIEDHAFIGCSKLVYIETHNRIRKIGMDAFGDCKNLPRIDIRSVVEICGSGFNGCEKLQFVEFGDKLETIGDSAFRGCPIEHLKLPNVISVDSSAFSDCERLKDVEFSEKLLECFGFLAFKACVRLKRIAIPLKGGLFSDGDVFWACFELTRVDLVGGVHQTVASLHMESWREEMNTNINRINLLLPDTKHFEKTQIIAEWMDSVIDRLDYYKTEHCRYVKEAATLLELALWKAKLDKKDDDDCCEESATKKAKIDVDDARKESRVTCGADTVIKNVLPFLQLLE